MSCGFFPPGFSPVCNPCAPVCNQTYFPCNPCSPGVAPFGAVNELLTQPYTATVSGTSISVAVNPIFPLKLKTLVFQVNVASLTPGTTYTVSLAGVLGIQSIQEVLITPVSATTPPPPIILPDAIINSASQFSLYIPVGASAVPVNVMVFYQVLC